MLKDIWLKWQSLRFSSSVFFIFSSPNTLNPLTVQVSNSGPLTAVHHSTEKHWILALIYQDAN